MMKSVGKGLLGFSAVVSLAMSGCRVDTHNNGDNQDVKIATPFGGMSVKTDDNAIKANVGLSVYPGAVLVKKEHHKDNGDTEHDNGAADVNMNFGGFHLGVKALSYETSDSPAKVIAFYRNDMKRYGQVIFCKDDRPIGSPTETQDGLRCNEDHKGVQIHGDEAKGSDGELKAGSRLHQHIVSIDPQGSGTKFGLVMLDLPGHLGIEDDDHESSQ